MSMSEIFTENYAKTGDGDYPLLDVEMLIAEGLKDSTLAKFKALCDTGSTGWITLTTDQVQKLKVTLGKKFNAEPEPSFLADNSIVYSDEYRVTLSFKGEKMAARLTVVDPKSRREATAEELQELEGSDVIGIVGRKIMDRYAVIFDGTKNPKHLTFSH